MPWQSCATGVGDRFGSGWLVCRFGADSEFASVAELLLLPDILLLFWLPNAISPFALAPPPPSPLRPAAATS